MLISYSYIMGPGASCGRQRSQSRPITARVRGFFNNQFNSLCAHFFFCLFYAQKKGKEKTKWWWINPSVIDFCLELRIAFRFKEHIEYQSAPSFHYISSPMCVIRWDTPQTDPRADRKERKVYFGSPEKWILFAQVSILLTLGLEIVKADFSNWIRFFFRLFRPKLYIDTRA